MFVLVYIDKLTVKGGMPREGMGSNSGTKK